MHADPRDIAPSAGPVRRSKRSLLATAPLSARIAMLIILAYLLVAIFAPLLAPFGEAEVVSQMPYAPPDAQFLLGTDQLGRDQLSRLIYGARNSMGIALATTLISFTLGSLLGITAAVLGGWVDQVLSRFVDVIMAIPQLIFALILLSIAGSSIPNLIIIIALLDSTRVFRVSRAVAMNVVAMEFIEAARLRGEGLAWIIRREILPNIMPTLIAEFGLRFCFAFLTISALSFLGLGIQPPTADWGSMVREASSLIAYGNLTLFIPAIAIAVLTISVNLVVDWFLDRASGLRNAN
ncbi:peptide/nickel transport system permease protein [Paracoccus sulfuroxidans]|uniref:Peptide/nickel transport system permease protein n=1 Tax=Paracoccus sulfuroxidans TaxID=384678 RepID=A0A562NHZ0_9RHOB|nr:peptide/nickel transport system permease protein [Paracoccus sulfuroxidans]